jgi:hypothetical protein
MGTPFAILRLAPHRWVGLCWVAANLVWCSIYCYCTFLTTHPHVPLFFKKGCERDSFGYKSGILMQYAYSPSWQ